ncbi:ddrgk domain protein [Cystoisospora suis]|uniref:Ddrgk domain protein n=1 Tax=Cystoisospora suis TaxID=483139 RepID=A0A2C6KT05_9APIC|nr:ddrgk domain protein [Cystoisospora suis]
MGDSTCVCLTGAVSPIPFCEGFSVFHSTIRAVLLLHLWHTIHAGASSPPRNSRGANQPPDEVADDISGGFHTLLSMFAIACLLALAVYSYRFLSSSRRHAADKTSAAVMRGGVPVDRGGNSSQQLTNASRRRMDRAALEELMAIPTVSQAGQDEMAGGGTASPTEETKASLRAAQRKREEREARRAERREERRQQGGEGGERTAVVAESDEDAQRTASQKTKGSSYQLRQLAKEKERLRREEEERRIAEEKKKKEEEEYNRWKAMFAVEESGEMALNDEEQERELDRFIRFLEGHKVTEVDDLAARFGLSAKDAVQRIRSLEDTGRLSGILDDRGKYVCVTEQELDALAEYLRLKGRIHKEKDLVPACNRIIRLQPDEEEKKRLDEEEREAMNLICLNEETEELSK